MKQILQLIQTILEKHGVQDVKVDPEMGKIVGLVGYAYSDAIRSPIPGSFDH